MSETKRVAPPKPVAPAMTTTVPLNKVVRVSDIFEHPVFIERISKMAPKHIPGPQMVRGFALTVRRNPKILECDAQSLIGVFGLCAALGFVPNMPNGFAYLIPRSIRGRMSVDFQIGYRGFLDIAWRSGAVKQIVANAVWPGDEFDYHFGSGSFLRHRLGNVPRAENAEPEYAYMHAMTSFGGDVFWVVTRADVYTRRAASPAYREAMAAYNRALKNKTDPMSEHAYRSCPWIAWPAEMWMKTAVRSGFRFLPQSPMASLALSVDDREVDYERVATIDPEAVEFGVLDDGPPQGEGGGADDPSCLFPIRDAAGDLIADPFGDAEAAARAFVELRAGARDAEELHKIDEMNRGVLGVIRSSSERAAAILNGWITDESRD